MICRTKMVSSPFLPVATTGKPIEPQSRNYEITFFHLGFVLDILYKYIFLIFHLISVSDVLIYVHFCVCLCKQVWLLVDWLVVKRVNGRHLSIITECADCWFAYDVQSIPVALLFTFLRPTRHAVQPS